MSDIKPIPENKNILDLIPMLSTIVWFQNYLWQILNPIKLHTDEENHPIDSGSSLNNEDQWYK